MRTLKKVYIAFPAPPELCEPLLEYLDNHQQWPVEESRKALRQLAETLTRTLLGELFLHPAKEIGLQGSKLRLVELGVDTLNRGVVMMVRRASRNMGPQQLSASAALLEPLLRPLPDSGENLFVAFRVPRHFYQRAREGLNDIQAGQVLENRPRMADMLEEMTLHFNRLFFDEPLRQLALAPVASRLVKATRDGTQTAVIGLVKRVINRLDREQTLAAAAYMESLLHPVYGSG